MDMQFTEDLERQILIVEDEGLIAADIQRRLQRLGYAVPCVARTGEEALQFVKSGPFDLILMDIRLKGELDGIATAEVLRTNCETPVVYITAHADQETIHRAKLTEPFGYILKPIGDGDLRSAVEIALYKHELERRLRNSEAWLSTTLRSIGDGVVATNTLGEIVFINPVAEQLTGWPACEAHGMLLMDVVGLHEESPRRPARNPTFDLLPGETRVYTLFARTGAKIPVEVACFENHSAHEVLGAILVMRDTTARRELEERLAQLQRMEAVANLAGGLAHDFNNQLTIILGYAQELADHLASPEKEQAGQIKNSASLASAITQQLLTLSRRDMMRPEVLNINEIICELQPTISHSLGKNRTLATNLGSPGGFVRADRNQLKQVLLNLALNARDAMPSGGELRIESSSLEVDDIAASTRLCRPGPYVRLQISDSGEGMDGGTLSHIFEPFFTTKKPGFGTGLGLSIVHSIVVQSGGYITARSELGAGTSFEILLPCLGTFQAVRDIAGIEAAGGEAVATILLVEDEDGVRRLMHGYLEREGYQLIEARNAEEAECIAEVYEEPIQILVTDIVMPGMSGPELAERIKRLRPDLKVLFVSGYRHDALESPEMASDLSALPKPFVAAELLRRVRTLLSVETHAAR
jgi:two-component system cell cycle sensor histidine kinase/response regulator CckA